MKKFLFSALLFAATASAAQAQISKGTALVGGSIGYSNTTSKSTSINQPGTSGQREATNRSVSINPSGGLCVAENLIFGLTAGFSTQKQDAPYYFYIAGNPPVIREYISESSSFRVAPFLCYYYLPVENFGLYGQLSGGYLRQWSTVESEAQLFSTEKTKGNGAFVHITPALVFFPINKLGLELTMGSIGYTSAHSKPKNLQSGQFGTETETSNFGANFGLSNLTLGASFYVGRQ